MAPIDPLEILSAFSPLLTDNGGIRQVDESQFLHLYSIMKDCSTKLISKCIYCNILMSTNSDVLEEFLKIGGWDLICLWIRASRDEGNISFLIELLKLLIILPMNLSRLRENDCPKIVKKLCKHENQEIALKANQIIKKWTKIIHTLSEKSSTGQTNEGTVNNCRNSNSSNHSNEHFSKDKKRKSSEASSSRDIVSTIKKQKSIQSTKSVDSSASNTSNSIDNAIGDSNVNNSCTNSNDSNNVSDTVNANLLSDSDPYEAFSRDDMNKFMVDTNKEAKVRPVTAKVKQGKFRLDLSQTSSKPCGKAKNKLESKSSKSTESKKASPINKSVDLLNKLGNGTNSKSSSTHVLKDSMSFMDALSSMPAINKKRRKLNSKESENATGSSSTPTTTPSSLTSSTSSTSNKVALSNQEMKNSLLESGSNPANMMQYSNTTNSNVDTYHNTHNANTNTSTINHNNNNSISGASIVVKPIKNDNLKDKVNNVEIKKSPPRFSFYKDILEDKSEDETNNSDSQSGSSSKLDTVQESDNDNHGVSGGVERLAINDVGSVGGLQPDNDSQDSPITNQQSESRENSLADKYSQPGAELAQDNDSNSVSEKVFIADGGASLCPLPPKSILNYIKKASKKSVRWAEDTKLELVKYFELDETERINVTRSSTEMKRFDMKHEAQMMMESKKERCYSYGPWRFIPIDLDSQHAVVPGCNSQERNIQAELMKTTLECFYIQNQIPDSPREPDLKFYADSNEQTKIIPLEDENMVDKVPDYNSIQSPVASDISGTPVADYSASTVPYNSEFNYNPSDNYQSTSNPISASGNNYTPILNASYQPSQSNQTNSSNYLSAPTFDNAPNPTTTTSSTNFVYNSYPSIPASQSGPANSPGPAAFPTTSSSSTVPTYQEYPNFIPPSNGTPLPTNQDLPPPLFTSNSNQPINYFNQPPPPSVVDNSYSQPPYWPENKQLPNTLTNFAPSGGNSVMPYNMPPGPQSGPRFRPRIPGGPSRGRGFHPRSPNSDVCRFFSRYGKCKFDQRCNFSHILDNSKSIRF